MTIRSRMSSIMNPLGLEQPELFALELGKLLNSTYFKLITSTNIDQSAPNFVKMFVRYCMSSIMGLNEIQSTRVICPLIPVAVFDLVFTVSIYMPI